MNLHTHNFRNKLINIHILSDPVHLVAFYDISVLMFTTLVTHYINQVIIDLCFGSFLISSIFMQNKLL